jgi:hypothetical protein
MSFKNRIEIHWLAAIIPMIMILSYPLIKDDIKIKKWFVRLATPVVVLLLLFRIYLALDIIPNVGNLKITFYNRESNALQIKELAQGKKVGFFNNYAAISNFMFYTGDSAVYLSTPDYRFCQYNLWNYEQFAEGDQILAIQSKHMDPPNLTRMTTGEMKGYIIIEDFQTLKELDISLNKISETQNDFIIDLALVNNNPFPIYTDHISQPVLVLSQNNHEILTYPLSEIVESRILQSIEKTSILLTVPKNVVYKKLPLLIYSKTKENIRGEVLLIKKNGLVN